MYAYPYPYPYPSYFNYSYTFYFYSYSRAPPPPPSPPLPRPPPSHPPPFPSPNRLRASIHLLPPPRTGSKLFFLSTPLLLLLLFLYLSSSPLFSSRPIPFPPVRHSCPRTLPSNRARTHACSRSHSQPRRRCRHRRHRQLRVLCLSGLTKIVVPSFLPPWTALLFLIRSLRSPCMYIRRRLVPVARGPWSAARGPRSQPEPSTPTRLRPHPFAPALAPIPSTVQHVTTAGYPNRVRVFFPTVEFRCPISNGLLIPTTFAVKISNERSSRRGVLASLSQLSVSLSPRFSFAPLHHRHRDCLLYQSGEEARRIPP